MANQNDVRRLALALPNVEESKNRFHFSVVNKGKPKAFAWAWNERIDPKKPRVPRPDVLAVRVVNVGARDLMIATDPAKFFTEPHYNAFPAVLVRLNAVSKKELEMLLADGWRCQASKELAAKERGRR